MEQNCNDCKNYWYERDTNVTGCKEEDNTNDDMWDGKLNVLFLDLTKRRIKNRKQKQGSKYLTPCFCVDISFYNSIKQLLIQLLLYRRNN